MNRKFFKNVFEISVLSEDGEGLDPSQMEMEDILHHMIFGGFSGKISHVKTVELSPKEAAQELIVQGSSPSFFQLDEEGNDKEDLGQEEEVEDS
jgi:hypothetical protein